jgi:hypothetical protein
MEMINFVQERTSILFGMYPIASAALEGLAATGKPIPKIEPMNGATCIVCGGSEQVSNLDIRWVNVHGVGNTGLPDHWELRVTAEARYEKWGLPYFDVVNCSRCNRLVALSEFMPSKQKRQTREECAFCSL